MNVGIGIFLGIIAGTIVQLIVEYYRKLIAERNLKEDLKFEMVFNKNKMDEFLDELSSYRNSVNGETLFKYYGYFGLSKCLWVSSYKMLDQGLLYRILSYEDVGELIQISSELSAGAENYMNNTITWNREHFGENGIKQKAADDADFWEKKFKNYKRVFERIHNNLILK